MNATFVAQRNTGCLVQLVWFALVGWWLGQAWMAAAWFLAATVIGTPLAIMMLDRLPDVIALRGQRTLLVQNMGGRTIVRDAPQPNVLLRLLYFVLVGWWLSAVWMELAYAICLTIIGLPLGFWMLDQVPLLVSLKQ